MTNKASQSINKDLSTMQGMLIRPINMIICTIRKREDNCKIWPHGNKEVTKRIFFPINYLLYKSTHTSRMRRILKELLFWIYNKLHLWGRHKCPGPDTFHSDVCCRSIHDRKAQSYSLSPLFHLCHTSWGMLSPMAGHGLTLSFLLGNFILKFSVCMT